MANSLTTKQVEHVAKLANLSITTKETEIFKEQLSEVIEYVSKISEVKVEGGGVKGEEPGETAVLREDRVDSIKCLTQEEAVSGTENKHNGMFVVPAIFES